MSNLGVEFKPTILAAGQAFDPEVRLRPRTEHVLFDWRAQSLRSDPVNPNYHLSHPRELLFQDRRRILSLRFGRALRCNEVQRSNVRGVGSALIGHGVIKIQQT
jgi:hypothetical protein